MNSFGRPWNSCMDRFWQLGVGKGSATLQQFYCDCCHQSFITLTFLMIGCDECHPASPSTRSLAQVEGNSDYKVNRFNDVMAYKHIIILQKDISNACSTYFLIPSHLTLELYLIGDNDMEKVTQICNKIHGA